MARNKAREIVKKVISNKADKPQIWYGYLGDARGIVAVSNRPGYVYVTLTDGMVTQAYNTMVPEVPNLPVILGYDSRQPNSALLRVLDIRNIPRSNENSSKYRVMDHHAAHEWMHPDGGADVVYVQLRQFMPLRPQPLGTIDPSTGVASNPYTVYISRDVQFINGTWQVVGGINIDLTAYVPASATLTERFVLLSLSYTSGSIVQTSGSAVPIGTISTSHVPSTPANNSPICAVRLYSNQVIVAETRTGTDLLDLRLGVFDSVVSQSYVPYTGALFDVNLGTKSLTLQTAAKLLISGSAARLDMWAQPIDTTDLNVSGSAHGLAPKAPADASKVLIGTGAWGDLPAHKTSHENGGADEISVAGLSGVLADRQDADKIYGRDVASTAPTDGQVLAWSATNSRWQPGEGGGSGSSGGGGGITVLEAQVFG